MKDEREEARQFTEELDKMLAGKETGAGHDEKMLRTLDFARKIRASRNEPSAQFESRLKQRLLTKMAERNEAKQKTNWLTALIRQPVWRTVTAVLVIAIVAGAAWGAGIFRNSENHNGSTDRTITMNATTATQTSVPESTQTPMLAATAPPNAAGAVPSLGAGASPAPTTTLVTIPAPVLLISASTDRTSYAAGDIIDIKITMQNTAAESITLDNTPPNLSIMSLETQQPVYTFNSGGRKSVIDANGVATYTWELNTSNSPLPKGSYYIELEDISSQGRVG